MRVDAVQPCAAGSRNPIPRIRLEARVGDQQHQERNEYPAGSPLARAHRFRTRIDLPHLGRRESNGRRDVGGGLMSKGLGASGRLITALVINQLKVNEREWGCPYTIKQAAEDMSWAKLQG